MRRASIVALVVAAPCVAGCLLELSPRPGAGRVRSASGLTMVVLVEAGAAESAGAEAGAEADATGEASVDAAGD